MRVYKYLRKRRKTVKEIIYDNIALISSVIFSCWVGYKVYILFSEEKEGVNFIKSILNSIITICSIMPAILLTYIISKSIQQKQEKLYFLQEYNQLTQKLHYFRACIWKIFIAPEFWPAGLKYHLKQKYPSLSFYAVRSVTFVNQKEYSKLASDFIKDSQLSSIGNLYLELEAFFPWKDYMDTLVYSEDESFLYYPYEIIDLWTTFNCGSGLYTYFDRDYNDYKDTVDFNSISSEEKTKVEQLAAKVDKKFKKEKYGPQLFSSLGGHVSENILPKLLYVSAIISNKQSSLLKPVLYWTILIFFFGLIMPLLITYIFFHIVFAVISIGIVITILLNFCFSIFTLIEQETQLKLPTYRKDIV